MIDMRKLLHVARFAAVLAAALAISACARNAEDAQANAAGAATPGGNTQRFVRDLDLPGQWWTLFHSRGLNELIDKALAANPDLQAAQAALVVARENVYVQVGAYFPAVDGNFTGSRGVSDSPRGARARPFRVGSQRSGAEAHAPARPRLTRRAARECAGTQSRAR